MRLATGLIPLAFAFLLAGSVVAHECALQIVRGVPNKSTLHYHLYNNIFGAPVPGTLCVTYGDVDNAIHVANSRINIVPPKEDWTPDDLGPVGEVLLEASRIIASKYRLTPAEIAHQLPMVDTRRTAAAAICPRFASPLKCMPGRYRRIDGLCNNLHYPTWGATRAVFVRLIPPHYSDGISSPRVALDGSALPNSRVVSAHIHKDDGFHDHAATTMLVAWGQFMDHDFTLTATPLDPRTRNELEACCHLHPNEKNPYCFEISIPKSDAFYSLFGFKCLDFVRGFPGVPQNCGLGPRNQFNILTAVIDGNTVYGGNEEEARNLRAGVGGLLRYYEAFPGLPLKYLLPLKTDIPDEGCMRGHEDQRCFVAGEIRVNEQLILGITHTLMMREHNRIAHVLANLNPHWDDERLYQEARRIVAAQIQHITYNEFLPQLLGKEVMARHGLLLSKGYWDGYDPKVNPGISAVFSAAAFRFGHSVLPSAVERWSPSHKFIGSKRLSQLIRKPYDLFRPGVLDEYIMGMANQPCQAMDDGITQEVTNHLFEQDHQKFGFDLVAFNMQRGREFGVPGYGAWRKFCGLDPVSSFADLTHLMTNYTAKMYSEIYKFVDDIDVWSAGVSERPHPGSMLGPVFSCIIANQMQRARKGDRYWYELPGQPSSFTPKQLAAIKQTTFARIICDNSDTVENIQLYPMVLQDPRLNPRMSCKSAVIPHIDLTPWIESPIGHGPDAYPPATQIEVFSTAKSLHAHSPAVSSVQQSYFYGYGLAH